jgi:N-acetylglucosamine-6-phosphate deacetylase
VVVRDGVIAEAGETLRPPPDAAALAADGLLLAPGYVDLQVNGALGVDLTERPEGLWEVAAALPRWGVTSFLPTAVTGPLPVYGRALAALAAGPPPGWRGARPLGWHFEGPMLSPRRPGAHPVEHLRAPSAEIVAGWSREAGVAMATLAPELPGALEVVRTLAARGVVVSMGHTEASAAEARAAVAAGVRSATHLFNAMAPMGHREPGPAGLVLGGGDVVAGLIADGVHVDPLVVALAWRALGPERFVLVSDAMAGLGLPAGIHRLGGADVRVGPDGARLPDGTLAGSAVGVDAGVRNLADFAGCPPADAVVAATRAPAALLGRGDIGTLAAGAAGDLVLLDGGLRVVATVVGGSVRHDARASGEAAPSRS